jgi:predicted RND superfamily exporter protein
MDKYRGDAELFLGGVSMIADDMITFVKNDLKVFGLGVMGLLILTLGIIFRRIRWICLPMLCCVVSVVCMIGLLGRLGWEVTVVSSNFISLQLILTMAIAIHLIVRYRELVVQSPQAPNRELILDAVRLKLKPCVYAVLTTIAGFGSLVLCDILPVITFGWMMIAGLIVSLVVTFLIFPTVLMLMSKDRPGGGGGRRLSVTSALARFTEAHGVLIVGVSGLVLIASLIGISKLKVENSFIDYFKETTEIYQGMKVIDQQLGGTTPLDVIVEFEGAGAAPAANDVAPTAQGDDEFGEFEELEEAASDEKYWFTAEKMRRIKAVHEYLDNIPETGKVLSLATMLSVAEKLNEGKPLDSFELALLYSETPEKFKRMLVGPYVSVEHNQARFWVRVRDSEKTLRRNELLKKIKAELTGISGLEAEHVHLAGLLVLYNNMLQSLFGSQIVTLGITVLALMVMFLVLFRSLKLALIAIFPNVLSIAAVLGVMGWLDMPLDMMTITIAAISVGIAVDDTIHYIHRFKREFEKDRSYLSTMHRCHGSIGHAMYYTSVTIIIGFSILALSNFIPSIYFGLLTSLAMLIALIAALTLLPQMLILVKPFGREGWK